MENNQIYDMIVIGGGPGGFTAALYAARAGLSVLVVEKLTAGGQMNLTHQIDNYPGFPEGIDGYTLGDNMKKQAQRFGAETLYAQACRTELLGDVKQVMTDGETYRARTVILATGADHRDLGVAKEKELVGRGVAYCAACDGMFYRGKTVAVVGGGDSAVADALLLSRIAQKVILVHRRDTLRATKVYHNQLINRENVEIYWNTAVKELLSDDKLSGVFLQNLQTGEETELACDGLFISVGRRPMTDLFADQVNLDDRGYVIAGEDTETNLPGVYAVGDIRTKELRQIVTAVADGAMAAHRAEAYLSAKEETAP